MDLGNAISGFFKGGPVGFFTELFHKKSPVEQVKDIFQSKEAQENPDLAIQKALEKLDGADENDQEAQQLKMKLSESLTDGQNPSQVIAGMLETGAPQSGSATPFYQFASSKDLRGGSY